MNFFAWRFGRQCAAACDESLAEHDKKYHPNGFDPERETCNKRAELAKADKGDVLSPSKGAENGGGEKPLVSAAEDAAYMDAVKRGDMKKAQSLVRKVANRYLEGSLVKDKAWHSTKKKFSVFQNSFPNVFFFAKDKKWAVRFGDKERNSKPEDAKSYYLKIRNPLDMMSERTGREWADFFREHGINIGENAKKKLARFENDKLPGWSLLNHDSAEPHGTGFRDSMVSAGYDGAVFEDVAQGNSDRTSYGVFHSNRIKSADSVTYDDDGKVIPLSRRFDGGDDIRGDVSKK